MDKRWQGQGRSGSGGQGHSGGVGSSLIIPNPKLKLLDQLREVMRLKHYSLSTERTYSDWIRRYIHFHHLKMREELMVEAEKKVELFLSDLAVNGEVAAATQMQAFRVNRFAPRGF